MSMLPPIIKKELPKVKRHPVGLDGTYSSEDYTDLTYLKDALDKVEIVHEDDPYIGPAYGKTKVRVMKKPLNK
jgi:hypothetical protein